MYRTVRGMACLAVAGVVTLTGLHATHAVAGHAQAASTQAADQRPNIVLIVTDDQSLHDLTYMPLTRRLIAAEGVTFSGISPHPLCCPARAEILTGQFAQNNGVRANAGPYGGFARLDPSSTVATWLDAAGYQTAFMGKFLNGYEKNSVPLDPLPGWDDWDATVDGVYDYTDFGVDHDGVLQTYTDTYQTDFYTNVALQKITKFSRSEAPFFIWQSYMAPHGACAPQNETTCWKPPVPAERHQSEFGKLPLWDATNPSFNEADMSDKPLWMHSLRLLKGERLAGRVQLNRDRVRAEQAVDEGVAKIVARLEATDELDNTLIMFTSDNGYMIGEHRWTGKLLPYEQSLRVPLLIRGPGIPEGVRVNEVATTVDIAPTIAAAAHALPTITVDGHDLARVARGASPSWRTLLIQGGPRNLAEADGTGWFFRGVRTNRYTFVSYGNTDEWELYDRELDPDEMANVVDSPRYGRVRKEMYRRLVKLSRCAGDHSCNRNFGPDPAPLGESATP
jgi:arylsulfatase A-like enzyme